MNLLVKEFWLCSHTVLFITAIMLIFHVQHKRGTSYSFNIVWSRCTVHSYYFLITVFKLIIFNV